MNGTNGKQKNGLVVTATLIRRCHMKTRRERSCAVVCEPVVRIWPVHSICPSVTARTAVCLLCLLRRNQARNMVVMVAAVVPGEC